MKPICFTCHKSLSDFLPNVDVRFCSFNCERLWKKLSKEEQKYYTACVRRESFRRMVTCDDCE